MLASTPDGRAVGESDALALPVAAPAVVVLTCVLEGVLPVVRFVACAPEEAELLHAASEAAVRAMTAATEAARLRLRVWAGRIDDGTPWRLEMNIG